MNQILSYIMLIFLLLGAVDHVMGNRFGIGESFRQGVMMAGNLLLCMAGFLVLAPTLAHILAPLTAPLFRFIGADPSAIAGILLANDSGGAALAVEIADNQEAGLFHGLIVGAGIGTTVMYIIPISMANVRGEKRSAAISGLVVGIITAPLGCLAGGFCAGFDRSMVLVNTIPVLLVSIVLIIALVFFSQAVIPVFSALGRFLEFVAIFGFCCGAVELLAGVRLLPNMDTLSDVFPIVGGIAIFLAGAMPLLAVVQRLLSPAMKFLAAGMKISETSVSGLMISMINGLPAMTMLPKLDNRGCMLTTAFLVSGSCIFGDHAAFTAQFAPTMSGAVIVGKGVSAITAVLLAQILSPRLLRLSKPSAETD